MRYDTYIEPVPREEQARPLDVYRYGMRRHLAIKGLQALITRWSKAFLTEKGSDPTDPEYGAYIASLIGGNISSREALRDIVALSVSEATNDLQRYEREYPPQSDAERLDTATLERVVIDESAPGVEIYVLIENVLGDQQRVALPVSLNPAP